MSKYSEFREKIKVSDSKEENQKRYTYEDINIRRDEETGNLEVYIAEKMYKIRNGHHGWSTTGYRIKDTNIRNPKEKIYYTFIPSPLGHSYKREYDEFNQKRRYGTIYSALSVLQQVLGVSREEAYNMHFTQEELIDLIEKINSEKENAIFQWIDTIEYSENYKGNRTLQGLHIAVGYKYIQNKKRRFLKCVEDENIKITISENGTLEITKDGKKENISSANYSFVSTKILEDVSPGSDTSLGGYTLEAAKKMVEKHKKDKEKGEE